MSCRTGCAILNSVCPRSRQSMRDSQMRSYPTSLAKFYTNSQKLASSDHAFSGEFSISSFLTRRQLTKASWILMRATRQKPSLVNTSHSSSRLLLMSRMSPPSTRSHLSGSRAVSEINHRASFMRVRLSSPKECSTVFYLLKPSSSSSRFCRYSPTTPTLFSRGARTRLLARRPSSGWLSEMKKPHFVTMDSRCDSLLRQIDAIFSTSFDLFSQTCGCLDLSFCTKSSSVILFLSTMVLVVRSMAYTSIHLRWRMSGRVSRLIISLLMTALVFCLNQPTGRSSRMSTQICSWCAKSCSMKLREEGQRRGRQGRARWRTGRRVEVMRVSAVKSKRQQLEVSLPTTIQFWRRKRIFWMQRELMSSQLNLRSDMMKLCLSIPKRKNWLPTPAASRNSFRVLKCRELLSISPISTQVVSGCILQRWTVRSFLSQTCRMFPSRLHTSPLQHPMLCLPSSHPICRFTSSGYSTHSQLSGLNTKGSFLGCSCWSQKETGKRMASSMGAGRLWDASGKAV